jgi:putative DNA primase/helicase
LLDEFEDLTSPIGEFVRECCVCGGQYSVLKRDLYQAWRCWCEEHGQDHPGDRAAFGRNLLAAVPTISTGQPRVNGDRQRIYRGIALKDDP